MIYIVWRRATTISKRVDRAIRDSTAILAIFADRSQNAAIYRDCLDVLASGVSRIEFLGKLDEDSRRDLCEILNQMRSTDIAPDIVARLSEMAKESAEA